MRRLLEKIGLAYRPDPPSVSGYNPRGDDLYEFDARDSLKVPVDLSRGSFDLPAEADNHDSALLGIDVRVSSMAIGRGPHLDLDSSIGAVESHYFDRGARGMRWIDVSGMIADGVRTKDRGPGGARIRVRGFGVAHGPRADLLLFRNTPIGLHRVLVLAPHPDDAELAAFGLYKNTHSAIVTITGGGAGGDNYGHICSQADALRGLKGRLRLWDSLVVPLMGGVPAERIVNLGYPDGILQQLAADPQRCFEARGAGEGRFEDRRRSLGSPLLRPGARPCWESIVEDLAHVLRVFKPGMVVTPHPLLDAHPDHRCTSLALFDAVEQEGMQTVELLLYTNHPVYWRGWPFGPPANPGSLQPWLKRPALIRGVRSHPLSLTDQVEKLFALEAMHDLRRAPPSLTRELEWGVLGSLMEARDAFLRHRLGPFSYFRRAVRSRELFIVHPGSDASILRQRYANAPELW